MYGPRWVDQARLGDVRDSTIKSYRGAAQLFLDYLDEEGMTPSCTEEYDDLLVEWSFARQPTAGQVRLAVAAVEFVFPRMRGELPGIRQRLETKVRQCPPQHSVPCGRDLAALLGAEMASQRRARYGVGLRLQAALGLRPGELVHLVPEDLVARRKSTVDI